jgi:SAM-dependent methyltransferase
VRSHFDSIAADYDESLPPHVQAHYQRKRVRFIASRIPKGLALDVGCGTGVIAQLLASHGFQVLGLDTSVGMLRVARQRSFGNVVAGDGTALPFADGTFHLTFCIAVLHHVADRLRVATTLAEMARVTAPGGYVLVWDHNPRNPYWPLLMRRVPQDDGTERLVPECEIISGLRRGGADIVVSRQLGLVPDFVPSALLSVASAVEKVVETIPIARRLCAHNVVLARRPPAEELPAPTLENASRKTA